MFYVSIESDGAVSKTEFKTELEARQFAVSDVITRMWEFIVEDEDGDGLEGKYLWEYKEGAEALLSNALPASYRFSSWQTVITQA